ECQAKGSAIQRDVFSGLLRLRACRLVNHVRTSGRDESKERRRGGDVPLDSVEIKLHHAAIGELDDQPADIERGCKLDLDLVVALVGTLRKAAKDSACLRRQDAAWAGVFDPPKDAVEVHARKQKRDGR